MATVIGSTSKSSLITPISFPPKLIESIKSSEIIRLNPLSTSLSSKIINDLTLKLDQVSILNIPLKNISELGSDTEKDFSQVLDKFLLRINDIGGTRVPEIVKKLAVSVENENLQELANRILNENPGWADKIRQKFLSMMGKLNSKDTRDKFIDETRDILKGKSANLLGTMNILEGELKKELTRLEENVNLIEDVKDEYRLTFIDYLYEVIFTQAFLQKARYEYEQHLLMLDVNNPIHQSEIKELDSKLEALESRSLALEGTLTNLPADDLVISQIHNASVATRQELLTDIPSKFNRIKMTIIKLNSALIIKSAQSINEHSDKIDKALRDINQQVTKDVISTASNLAGENRKTQAEHVLAIVNETNELMAIAEEGRKSNLQKFNQARGIFDTARNLLKTK